MELVVRLARESDATVIGRHTDPDGMPEDLLEQILFEAGRPLIIAPDMAPSHSDQTIAIFWKDSPEVARAVTAAMPLLALATQVFVLSLPEEDGSSVDGLMALMKGLIDAGIKAEVKTLEAKGRAVSDALLSAAKEFCAE